MKEWTVIYQYPRDEIKVIELDSIYQVFKFAMDFDILLAMKTTKLNQIMELIEKLKEKR